MATTKKPDDRGDKKAKARPAMTRNAFIAGEWYGPAWGNEADYPATVSVESAPHLFDED